ncbi:DNA-deoxyinosine glycosylase [Amaricoccus solimangrovi]|uniref:DNA-deoxyinosine glycosylase n=1 Tax=Amaricoccus solimangrovi TaxID=2589815 RepID=A0A501X1B2_9RHOB|nr:DNA-deoxyinosine glycosylase [Amaricoccus solimangrovi]TPE53576.1 DNA-deoxyinosine glycosylase [Amaricoccus solimangrovi]
MTGEEPRARHFAPVADARTRVLILGSLPGVASLAAGQYYAHPRNGFWRLVGGVIGADLAALPYPARLDALRAAGIGLWDVVGSATRRGSLDQAIRDPEFADLAGLVATLPDLRAIAFNGATAARHGRARLADLWPGERAPDLLALPSSSPAHTLPLAEKARRWDALREYLG